MSQSLLHWPITSFVCLSHSPTWHSCELYLDFCRSLSNTLYYNYEIKDGYIHLIKRCRSNNRTLLFGLLITYLLVLIFALAVVAIITRRVRRQHFKDTKKVNILLFIICILIVIVFSYWLLLRTLYTERYVSNLPLHIGHSAGILLVLSFLFVPKILPPLRRRIKGTTRDSR